MAMMHLREHFQDPTYLWLHINLFRHNFFSLLKFNTHEVFDHWQMDELHFVAIAQLHELQPPSLSA